MRIARSRWVPGVLALLVASSASCSRSGPGAAPPTLLRPGDHEVAIRHADRGRRYIVHVPPQAAAGRPLPVMLAFHGGGGEAAGFKAYAGLDAVADREGFLVVYPFGTGVLPRRLLTWNAGACCGRAMDENIDDVGFAIAVLDDVGRRAFVDSRRVYATGHSNGAMMSYRLAAERADRIVAIAPVAGAYDLEEFSPAGPVAVLHIHSVDDPRALYEGGLGPPFPGTDVRSSHRPVMEGIGRWLENNGCDPAPRTAQTRQGDAGTVNEGQSATLLVWDGCVDGGSMAHWRLTRAGHGWPGTTTNASREQLIGPPTTLVDAAEEAWRFVQSVQR